METVEIKNSRLTLVTGDITKQETDAIVNAANSGLLGGGGVDGAIHRAGGPKILEECKKIREENGKCPTGEAVITAGGDLKAKYVIHTVGPIWNGGSSGEDGNLKNAYKNSLSIAIDNDIKTISFPSISTGAYRFPTERAAKIALSTVIEFLSSNDLEEVRFVLFSDRDYEIYRRALEGMNVR